MSETLFVLEAVHGWPTRHVALVCGCRKVCITTYCRYGCINNAIIEYYEFCDQDTRYPPKLLRILMRQLAKVRKQFCHVRLKSSRTGSNLSAQKHQDIHPSSLANVPKPLPPQSLAVQPAGSQCLLSRDVQHLISWNVSGSSRLSRRPKTQLSIHRTWSQSQSHKTLHDIHRPCF